MKINKKALRLIDKGLSAKTVSNLNESQIDVLYSKMNEAITQSTTTSYNIPTSDADKGVTLPSTAIQPGKNITVKKTPTGIKVTPNEEVNEDETDDVTDNSALGADALAAYTGQKAPHMANDMAPDGMDDDSDDDRKMMGMSEEKKEDEKSNPWAICTAQLGKEFGTKKRHLCSAKEKNKYERCVKDVKKSLKEGKNPVSLFLENEIMKIVEKNIPPRITKGDLVKYLSESGPAVAPSKPKTSPTTKPGKPATRPQKPGHPLKNPNPGEKPAPKAKKIEPEQAKDEVINAIMKILKNG